MKFKRKIKIQILNVELRKQTKDGTTQGNYLSKDNPKIIHPTIAGLNQPNHSPK